MPLTDLVRTGVRSLPPRLFVYGTEGIGKSTFASRAPTPIFVPTEDGLDQIDCHSFPVAVRYAEVVSNLTTLANDPHEYQTVVLDSADWCERLILADVCAKRDKTNIEDIGFAKGYTYALTQWAEVVALLDRLRLERNMCIIILAHSKVEKFEDPDGPSYDRYLPRLHKHVMALLTEWADAVLFARLKIVTKTEDQGFNKKRTTAYGLGANGGERILRTVGSPSCIAKNRYNLPAELPLSWAALMEAMSQKKE